MGLVCSHSCSCSRAVAVAIVMYNYAARLATLFIED